MARRAFDRRTLWQFETSGGSHEQHHSRTPHGARYRSARHRALRLRGGRPLRPLRLSARSLRPDRSRSRGSQARRRSLRSNPVSSPTQLRAMAARRPRRPRRPLRRRPLLRRRPRRRPLPRRLSPRRRPSNPHTSPNIRRHLSVPSGRGPGRDLIDRGSARPRRAEPPAMRSWPR